MKKHWSEKLIALDACNEAIDYARTQPSFAVAWKNCERGDWMLWYAGKIGGPPESASRKKLVLATCACARLSLEFVPKGELRPLRAIETAEAWANGVIGATLDDVGTAASAASAYAADAPVPVPVSVSAYAYAYAAYAYAYAAYAASASAYAAYAASAYVASAYAADASVSASSADAAYVNRKTLSTCADIVRSYYPKPPRKQP